MSRPRKMTLGDALEALKELPRVLKALEVLNGEQEKVRALMARTGPMGRYYVPVETEGETLAQAEERIRREAVRLGLSPPLTEADATRMFWEWRDAQGRPHSVPVNGGPIPDPGATIVQRPVAAILDTPERREYEEAKKAGIVVKDDPFRNASEAQRERMAEQRALVERLKMSRPPPTPPVMTGQMAIDEGILLPARTEDVDVSANGSLGTEVVT